MASQKTEKNPTVGDTTSPSTNHVSSADRFPTGPGLFEVDFTENDILQSAAFQEIIQQLAEALPEPCDALDVGSSGSSHRSSSSAGSSSAESSTGGEEEHTGSRRPYLSLLCAQKDYNDPNPHGDYYCHPSRGKGSCIVIIDSGVTMGRFPNEFDYNERRIMRMRLPPEIIPGRYVLSRPEEYTWNETLDDERLPRGHGTSVTIIAGGSQSGVAPLADLILWKAHSAFSSLKSSEGTLSENKLVVNYFSPAAAAYSIEMTRRHIEDGKLPKGKVVINISFGWKLEENRLMNIIIQEEFVKLAKLGVTIVKSAGNGSDYTVEDSFPTTLAGTCDSMILVGATDEYSKLWWGSTPGTEKCPVDLYAQGRNVSSYSLDTNKVRYEDGTSFAAPQVAGLAAYFLGHPDYQERFKYSLDDYANGNTVGKRMKEFLKELAYQRMPDDELLDPDYEAEYNFEKHPGGVPPSTVEVAYNGYHGPQKG